MVCSYGVGVGCVGGCYGGGSIDFVVVDDVWIDWYLERIDICGEKCVLVFVCCCVVGVFFGVWDLLEVWLYVGV